MNFTVNGGNVICSGSTCVCGITPVSDADNMYYKEINGCTQSGGNKLIIGENDFLNVSMSQQESMFLADFIFDYAIFYQNNGMVWSRKMRLGYLVTFMFCNITHVDIEHDYVVSARKEALRTAILREGGDLVDVLDENKYRLKYNGEFVDVEQPIKVACTMIAHQINGCVMCECENGYFNATPTAFFPCDDCDLCHYGECILSTGICNYSRKDGWQELAVQENECYELQCNVSEWMIGEKDEVKQWKKKTTTCKEYLCDNSTGLYYKYFRGNEKGCGIVAKPCYNIVCRNVTSDGECPPQYEKYEKVPGYEEIFLKQNECYEITCNSNNKWDLKERDYITEWKKGSNPCYGHVCDNETGRGLDNRCWKSEKIPRRCINLQCIKTERVINSPTVEILYDEVDFMEFNTTKFTEQLAERFGIKNEFTVAWETEYNGENFMIITLDNKDVDIAYAIASEAMESAKLNGYDD